MSRFSLQASFIEFLRYCSFMVGRLFVIIALFFQSYDERTSAPGTGFCDCFRATGLCASWDGERAEGAKKIAARLSKAYVAAKLSDYAGRKTRARRSVAKEAWADRLPIGPEMR
jgi:hypothetical protein